MNWTAAAEYAHGQAVDVVTDRAARYGVNAALLAEDEAEWCIGRMAEDLARAERASFVTPAHVAVAAAAYRYQPSLVCRIVAALVTVRRLVARTA